MNEKKRNEKMNRFNISTAGIFNSGVERRKREREREGGREGGKKGKREGGREEGVKGSGLDR